MASLSPVTAGQPVGEARFVCAILLPVRTPSLRRVFRDSDHAECVCVCWYSCGEIRTWHEVLVGDADGAQCVVRHRLNEVGDHLPLVVGCKRTRLAVVSDNPRTSEHTVRATTFLTGTYFIPVTFLMINI